MCVCACVRARVCVRVCVMYWRYFFIILTPNYGLFRGQIAGGRARAILESNLEPKLCKIMQHRFNISDFIFRLYEFYSLCHR